MAKKKRKKRNKEKQRFLGLYTHKVVITQVKKTAIWSMPEDIKGRMTWQHNQQGAHQMLTT